ncbi:MAG: hypothetical protein PSX37_03105 [bacterium]|nr:hypothetical protein [bacterium]
MAAIRLAIVGIVVAAGLVVTAWQLAASPARTMAPGPVGHQVQLTVY